MRPLAGAAPIPGILELLRRENRIPAEADRAAARIREMPAESHQRALLAEGIVSEEDIAQSAAKDVGLPFRAINPAELNPEVVTGALPAPFARRHTICALSKEGGALTVAVANPYERAAIDDLERYLGVEVEVVVATRSDIESVNGSLYNLRTSLRAAETELEGEDSGAEEIGARGSVSEADAGDDLEPTTRPVVSALDSILRQAFEQRASDIHLEPRRDRAAVRFRVDGVLRTMHTFPRIVYRAVVSRIKMLSGLDIAEKRRPQDGRFKRIEGEKEIELRVSTLPTVFGEKAVLRVFDPAALVSSLEQLRLAEDDDARLRAMLGRREGLLLVTGPTGSGKTTTLYSVLRQVATPEVNVITIEDPVELVQPGLSQVQVHPRIDFTFAAAIRSVLRQDPDILMVGEIRDPETAEMAVQAALTGHLVLSTLHTNDAASSVTRLADLGVPRFLISTTLIGVLAQRLVRTVCRRCAHETRITVEDAEALAVPEIAGRVTRHGHGCVRCRDSGYRGRRGVFEVMEIDPGGAARILEGADAAAIAGYARSRGCRSLRQAALRLLLSGETTITEVVRVTGAGADPGTPSVPGPASVPEGTGQEQQQRRKTVEDADHIGGSRGSAAHCHLGQKTRPGQRDLPDPPHRVDESDPDHIEQQVHHGELETPRRVGSGDRERREERGDGGPDVGAESHREGVLERQEPGCGQGDQQRGGHRTRLHHHGDQSPDGHGEQRVPPEDAMDRVPGALGGESPECPHDQSEADHDEGRGQHAADTGRQGALAGDLARQPEERRRDEREDPLDRAPVLEAGPAEAAEEGHQRGREPGEQPGDHFEREQDRDRQQVEQVVAGGDRERPPQLFAVPQVPQRSEGVRDRGADVRAHHHRNGALEGQRRDRRGDQGDDERTGDRRTLEQGRGQHAHQKAQDRVRGGFEEPVQQTGPQTLETVAESADPAQEEEEEADEGRDAEPDRPPALAGPDETVPAQREGLGSIPAPEGSGRPGRPTKGAIDRFRFEMDG